MDGVSDGVGGLMEKNVVVTQDMVDAFTEEMQEATKSTVMMKKSFTA